MTVRVEADYYPERVLLDNHRFARTEWVEVLIWMGDSDYPGLDGGAYCVGL